MQGVFNVCACCCLVFCTIQRQIDDYIQVSSLSLSKLIMLVAWHFFWIKVYHKFLCNQLRYRGFKLYCTMERQKWLKITCQLLKTYFEFPQICSIGTTSSGRICVFKMHQMAPYNIWKVKNFPGVIPPDPLQ